MEHNLTIKQDHTAICDCGEAFKGTPTEVVNAWQDHYATTVLLVTVREQALVELDARMRTEVLVGRLVDLGLSAVTISKAIGKSDGKDILSPFKVQSIAKKNTTPAPVKKTGRKTTIKKA